MLTSPELAVIVEDCGSTALLASGTCTERIGTGLPASVRLRVSFDDAPADAVRLVDLLSNGPADWDSSSAQARDLCSISYTSGTTGHPKGAMQAAMTRRAAGTRRPPPPPRPPAAPSARCSLLR
jgi:long-chain acyl-CoA synthetase